MTKSARDMTEKRRGGFLRAISFGGGKKGTWWNSKREPKSFLEGVGKGGREIKGGKGNTSKKVSTKLEIRSGR